MKHHNQLYYLFSITLLFTLLSTQLSAERCHSAEKKTLQTIKKAFNNAYAFTSWTNDLDCCDWNLVQCDDVTNHIISLSVTKDDEVAGPIPEAVGDLPYLEELIFIHLPKLTGPIPQSISKLKNLNTLWLSHNNLTGTIPNFLGTLKKLTYINLSVNKLSGPIPPSLSSLPALGALFLERNQLTGPLPESFVAFKNNPDFYLKLAKNKLSGTLPKSIGAANFTVIDLSRNMFTGDASMFFGKNKGLQNLVISRNKFSFDLTKVVVPKDVYILDISHNLIYGSLPPTLAKLSNLQQLNVSYNRLCGKIPTGGELNRFDKYDYAHNKCLCGTPLPPCK